MHIVQLHDRPMAIPITFRFDSAHELHDRHFAFKCRTSALSRFERVAGREWFGGGAGS